MLSSIDGNAELLATAPPPAPPGGIRINISKPLPAPSAPPASAASELDDVSGDEEPPPPGEEPELTFALKPRLQGAALARQPPVRRGNELSGLCSVM